MVPSLQSSRPISLPNFLMSTANDAACIKFLIYEKNSSFDKICRQFLMDKKLWFGASSDTQCLPLYVKAATIYPLSKSFANKQYLYCSLMFGYKSS